MNKTIKSIITSLLLGVSAVIAYTPNYTTEDMDDIFADILGFFGTAFIPFISLIVIVIVIYLVARVWKRVTGGPPPPEYY